MIKKRRPFTFDRVSRIFFTLLIVSAIVYLTIQIKNALLPFLVAWLFAYLLNPMVGFFQYKLKFRNRTISIMLALLSVALIIFGIIFALFPLLSVEIDNISKLIAHYQAKGSIIHFFPKEWTIYFQQNINTEKIISSLSKDDINQLIQQLAPKLWFFLTSSFSIIMGILASAIILLYIIFILHDFDRITSGFINLFPLRYRKIAGEIMNDVSFGMNRYFRGQALVSLCVGILTAIGFKIIDIPVGLILGLVIGLMNLIPYLHTLGVIPLALVSMLKASETGESFWVIFGLGIAVMCIVQAIQDLIIVPKVMGRVTGLNPAIILLSLSIWGSLMGMIGLIIALPLTTLCLSYYKRYILLEEDENNFTCTTTDNKADNQPTQ